MISCSTVTSPDGVKNHQIDSGLCDRVGTAERERIKALGGENKELRQANDIWRLPNAFFASGDNARLEAAHPPLDQPGSGQEPASRPECSYLI